MFADVRHAGWFAGGMIVLGKETAGLFDGESGRWLELPQPMAQPRAGFAQLVSLPASALQAAAAGNEAIHSVVPMYQYFVAPMQL